MKEKQKKNKHKMKKKGGIEKRKIKYNWEN